MLVISTAYDRSFLRAFEIHSNEGNERHAHTYKCTFFQSHRGGDTHRHEARAHSLTEIHVHFSRDFDDNNERTDLGYYSEYCTHAQNNDLLCDARLAELFELFSSVANFVRLTLSGATATFFGCRCNSNYFVDERCDVRLLLNGSSHCAGGKDEVGWLIHDLHTGRFTFLY